MTTRRCLMRVCVCVALLLPLAVVAGCHKGPAAVAVKGQVTNAGQPLHVAGREQGLGMVQLECLRLGEDGRTTADAEGAVADDQGRFEVHGRDGKGILPGKYRIAVRQWDPYPQNDKLGGKFSEANSRIVREISGGEDINIDVSRPEG